MKAESNTMVVVPSESLPNVIRATGSVSIKNLKVRGHNGGAVACILRSKT